MSQAAPSKLLQILLVSFNQVGQGTFRRAYSLGRALGERGHSVVLMATRRAGRWRLRESRETDITLIETPDLLGGSLRSGWDPWNTLRRVLWARGREFDVVHAFESRPTVVFPSLYARASSGAVLVMDWADWFGAGGSVEQRPNPLIRAALRPVETLFEERFRHRADGATVISEALEQKALRAGVAAGRILHLVNGSDTTRIHPLDPQTARRQLGLPSEGAYIGHMGAIFRDDARLMAAAFDLIVETLPQVRLLVAGYCPFDIRQMSRHPDGVIQTGYVEERLLNAHLASCDVLWLPMLATNANRSRLPLKVNDYMAAGRPVVTTDVGDWPEHIRRQKFGVVTQAEPSAFAHAAISLLSDEGLRRQLGETARSLALTEYQWSALAEKLDAFYVALSEKIPVSTRVSHG